MYLSVGHNILYLAKHSKVGNDKSVYPRTRYLFQIASEYRILVTSGHRIDRKIKLFVSFVNVLRRGEKLVVGKIIGSRAHTEASTREIYRVRPVKKRRPQLFKIPRGGQQFGGFIILKNHLLFLPSQTAELLDKGVKILKLSVNRCKADVRDLISLLEFVHDHLSDLLGGDLV